MKAAVWGFAPKTLQGRAFGRGLGAGEPLLGLCPKALQSAGGEATGDGCLRLCFKGAGGRVACDGRLPATRLFRTPSHVRTVPVRRAVIRKPGPRACFKRRSGARLSLPRQTCRQGSGRRLQALGHCFRAAAPQAHFLLTFWGASQKVRRCKSAKRFTSTGKTPDADARTNLPRYSPLPPNKKPTLTEPRLFRTPSLARTIPARRAVIRKPGPRACFKRRSGARLSLLQQTCRQGSERRLQALGHCFRAAAPKAHFLLTFWGASQKVRRCKSAIQSPATGVLQTRTRGRTSRATPLFPSQQKDSTRPSAKSPTTPLPASSAIPPTLGRCGPGERSFGNRGLEPVSSAEAEPD